MKPTVRILSLLALGALLGALAARSAPAGDPAATTPLAHRARTPPHPAADDGLGAPHAAATPDSLDAAGSDRAAGPVEAHAGIEVDPAAVEPDVERLRAIAAGFGAVTGARPHAPIRPVVEPMTPVVTRLPPPLPRLPPLHRTPPFEPALPAPAADGPLDELDRRLLELSRGS